MKQVGNPRSATRTATPLSGPVLLAAAIWAGVALVIAAAAVAQQTLAGIFGEAAPAGLVDALGLAGLSFGFRFLRWHRLATRLAPDLSLSASLEMQAIGFALSATPGKLGELLKIHLLASRTGVPAARGVSIVLVEKLTEALVFATLALVGGILVSTTFAPGLTSVSAMVGLAGVGLGLVALKTGVADRIGGRLARLPKPFGGPFRRLQPLLGELSDGSERLARPGPLAEAFALCAAARVCDSLALTIVVGSLGLPVPVGVALLALGTSGTVGGLSMLPGGVGAVEATMTGVLLAAGLGAPAALAATLIGRGIIYWLWVAIGLVFAIRHTRRSGGAA